MVDFYGINVGIYTIPMDPMGYIKKTSTPEKYISPRNCSIEGISPGIWNKSTYPTSLCGQIAIEGSEPNTSHPRSEQWQLLDPWRTLPFDVFGWTGLRRDIYEDKQWKSRVSKKTEPVVQENYNTPVEHTPNNPP